MRVPAYGDKARPYAGFPRLDVLLWDLGVPLAALLACALAAGVLTGR